MPPFDPPQRDPERVIRAIRAVLAVDPDLRVGQAIAIATKLALGHFDSFSIEDPALAESLDRYAERRRG